MRPTQPLWRYRLAVASRTLAAVAGGYALTAAFTAAAAPAHVLTPSATVRRLVNMTALAVAEAHARRTAG